jgi:TPP-dependent 2-oxoacid decarboxylase
MHLRRVIQLGVDRVIRSVPCSARWTAAPERRHILFVGDGSFQVTAQELSTILRHDHNR